MNDEEFRKARNARIKVLRDVRIKRNICPVCGKEPLISGKRYGRKCKQKRAAYGRILRDRRRDNGLCTNCGAKTENSKSCCAGCLRKTKRKQVTIYTQRKRSGLCICCGKPLATNSTIHCRKHVKKQRGYEKKYQAEKAKK